MDAFTGGGCGERSKQHKIGTFTSADLEAAVLSVLGYFLRTSSSKEISNKSLTVDNFSMYLHTFKRSLSLFIVFFHKL